MKLFKRARKPFMAQLGTKGEWDRSFARGKPRVVVCCPGCGTVLGVEMHEIAPDGTISPSCMCPINGCEFHDTVKLEDWVDPEGVTREKIAAVEGVCE